MLFKKWQIIKINMLLKYKQKEAKHVIEEKEDEMIDINHRENNIADQIKEINHKLDKLIKISQKYDN